MHTFRTLEGTAQADKHFEMKEGEIVFEDNQTEYCLDLQLSEFSLRFQGHDRHRNH